MGVNDNACCLNGRGAIKSIASKLAPALLIVRGDRMDSDRHS